MSKFEITKKEEDSPPHSTSLCPPVSSLPEYHIHLTATSPHALHHLPPPKRPPFSAPPLIRTARHRHRRHPPHPPPAVRILLSSPPTSPSYPKHALDTHRSTPPGWAHHSPTTSTQPCQLQATPTSQRLRVALCGSPSHGPITMDTSYLSTFPATSSITSTPQHTAPTPSPPCPAPPANYQPTTTTNTTTVFPPVPPIPDAPLTDQQAATLHHAILRIARQAAAAAAAEMTSR